MTLQFRIPSENALEVYLKEAQTEYQRFFEAAGLRDTFKQLWLGASAQASLKTPDNHVVQSVLFYNFNEKLYQGQAVSLEELARPDSRKKKQESGSQMHEEDVSAVKRALQEIQDEIDAAKKQITRAQAKLDKLNENAGQKAVNVKDLELIQAQIGFLQDIAEQNSPEDVLQAVAQHLKKSGRPNSVQRTLQSQLEEMEASQRQLEAQKKDRTAFYILYGVILLILFLSLLTWKKLSQAEKRHLP